jgi:hypothetical protein
MLPCLRPALILDDFNRFCALIHAMDAAYLAYFKDKPPDAQP